MLSLLLNDHNNMRKILTVLQNEVDTLKNNQTIHCDLLRSIINYLQGTVEKNHHFIEEHIYEYCLDQDIQSNGLFASLASEHQQLENKSEALAKALDDDELAAQLGKHLEQFIAMQKAHMSKEEEFVAPLLKENLSADDWQKIAAGVDFNADNDPLFGTKVASKYLQLAEHIASTADSDS